MVDKSARDKFKERLQQKRDSSPSPSSSSGYYSSLHPDVLKIADLYYSDDPEGREAYLAESLRLAQKGSSTPPDNVPPMPREQALKELEEIAREARRDVLYTPETEYLSMGEGILLSAIVLCGYFSIHKSGWQEGLGARYRVSVVIAGRIRAARHLADVARVFNGRFVFGKKGSHTVYVIFENTEVIRRICFLLRLGEIDIPDILEKQLPIIEEFLSAKMPGGRPRDKGKRNRIYNKRKALYEEFMETKKLVKDKNFLDTELQDPRDAE